jgi:hypothetical protein
MGCQMFPYDKRSAFCTDHLKFIHGIFVGVHAARQTALVYADAGETVVFGHAHAIDDVAIAGLTRRRAMMAGCLCNLNMEYARQMPNALRWSHGFCYGWINRQSGEHVIEQAKEQAGRWTLPTEVTLYQ